MDTGALYDYVSTMPHEGWRNVLPTFISMYKNGTSDVTQESLTAYYSEHHIRLLQILRMSADVSHSFCSS